MRKIIQLHKVVVENQKITSQNRSRASWTFNQALQEETNRDVQGAQETNAGQRACALPDRRAVTSACPVAGAFGCFVWS